MSTRLVINEETKVLQLVIGYRVLLRNLTSETENPESVIWPVAP